MFVFFSSEKFLFIPSYKATKEFIFLSLMFLLANYIAPLLLVDLKFCILPQKSLAYWFCLVGIYISLYGFFRSTFLYFEWLYYFLLIALFSTIPKFIMLKFGFIFYSITQLSLSILLFYQLYRDSYKKFITYHIAGVFFLFIAQLFGNYFKFSDLQLFVVLAVYDSVACLIIVNMKHLNPQPNPNQYLSHYYMTILQTIIANLQYICRAKKSIKVIASSNQESLKLRFSPYNFLYFSSTIPHNLSKTLKYLAALNQYYKFKKTYINPKPDWIAHQVVELILKYQKQPNPEINITLLPLHDFIFEGNNYCLMQLLSHLLENWGYYLQSDELLITLLNKKISLSGASNLTLREISKKINNTIKAKLSSNVAIYLNALVFEGYNIHIQRKKKNHISIEIS